MNFSVAKFGGSSVQDAKAMARCCAIVAKDPSIKVIVVSATYNTTNQLEDIASAAKKGLWDDCQKNISALENRHLAIAADCQLSVEGMNQLNGLILELTDLARGIYLLKECSLRIMDQVYSIGERISSILFTQALFNVMPAKIIHLKDAREVIRTDDQYGQALPDPKEIKFFAKELWSKDLGPNSLIVTQGFIGSTIEKITTTLGREGSDFSATLLAEAFSANSIQIWKDVPGIASCDPRLIENVQFIPELSYNEMTELSTLGAKVLHPFTLRPAMRENIPVYVGSTFEPDLPGTWIRETSDVTPLVQALALRENQTLMTLKSDLRFPSYQFFHKVFSLFSRYKVHLDLITTHENSVSLLLNPRVQLSEDLKKDLSEFCQVSFEQNLALVSLVGHGMREHKGFMTRLFAFLDSTRIRQINFGTGEHGLSLLVRQDKAHSTLKLLHQIFIEDQEATETPRVRGQ